jgi:DNA-directed RNA polymerase II subunit RPB2
MNVLKSVIDDKIPTQLRSFNNFIMFGIQEIIDRTPAIMGSNYKLQFGKIFVDVPRINDEKLYPSQARQLNLTYESAIYCDITETKDAVETTHRRVLIGNIPAMYRSCICNLFEASDEKRVRHGECPNDAGGYFIINGNEKVIISQIRANYNQTIVLPQKSTADKKAKYKYIAEMRSMSTETGHSVLVKTLLSNDERKIFFSLPYVKEPIPIGIVFKALGFSDDEICNFIGFSKDDAEVKPYYTYILRYANGCKSRDDAFLYIAKLISQKQKDEKEDEIQKKILYIEQVLDNELFPHLGVSNTTKERACILGSMVRKLIATNLNRRNPDDRDNYAMKRIDTTGALFYDIFRHLINKMMVSFQDRKNKKQLPEINSLVQKSQQITNSLRQCLLTGRWSVQKNAKYFRNGVSQPLERLTYGATLSQLRRIVIQTGNSKGNKSSSSAIRQIHGTQFGYVCPCETPEGEKVGAVLNLALTARVTIAIPYNIVLKVIETADNLTPVSKMEISEIQFQTPVYLNSRIIGFTSVPNALCEQLRGFRNNRILDWQVSIAYDPVDNEVKIYCDEGRLIRPFFVLENNSLPLAKIEKYANSTSKLIRHNVIRMLDVWEFQYTVIAMNPKAFSIQTSEYCEIHPASILGIMASIIPFSDHTQSPRNCYQSSMGKQALGMSVRTYNTRFDNCMYVMNYVEKPIVCTQPSTFLGFNDNPSGNNIILAVCNYRGFNQEDSVIVNEDAIKRGLFELNSFSTITHQHKRPDGYSEEQICIPPMNSDPTIKEGMPGYFRRLNANYSLLDENGLIRERYPLEFCCSNSACIQNGVWTVRNSITENTCNSCSSEMPLYRGGHCMQVKKGDIIIGNVRKITNKNGDTLLKDMSRIIQGDEEGLIHRVFYESNSIGQKILKIVIRKIHIPEEGDKVATRHGQKGTMGMIVPSALLPFTSEGLTPDIIINPLCIPSRMTINMIYEMYLGKASAFTGTTGDATPFSEVSENIGENMINRFSEEFTSRNLDPKGWDTMYNGITGEPLEAKIYTGIVYYQRLKHLIKNKIHARAEGTKISLTRQPTEGKAHNGGLRIGEMERDCALSHGISGFLHDQLFFESDRFQIPICKECQIMTAKRDVCQNCNSSEIVICNLPYAAKLLFQELIAMSLNIRLVPEAN